MAANGNQKEGNRTVKNEPMSSGDVQSSSNTNSMPAHGVAPMLEPKNAWRECLSGEESDLDLRYVPCNVSEWGTGSRGHTVKRLLTSNDRKVLGRAHRKNRDGVCEYPFNLDILSSGEEGEKPTRPSDIVGDESDSCSDFAYAPKMRVLHRRRKHATAMRIRNIDTSGRLINSPGWLLRRRGMSKYGSDLRPPPEDIYVPRTSECREFLSRNSRRGSKYKHFPGDLRRKCTSEEETCATADESLSTASAGCPDDQDYFELSDVLGPSSRSLASCNLANDDDNMAHRSKYQTQHLSRSTFGTIDVDLIPSDHGNQSNLTNGGSVKLNEITESVLEDGEVAEIENGHMANLVSCELATISNGYTAKGKAASLGEHGEEANLCKGSMKKSNSTWFGYTLASPTVKSGARAKQSTGRGIFSTGKRLRVLSHLPPPKAKRKKDNVGASLLDEMNYQVFNDPASLFGPKAHHLRDPVTAAKFKANAEIVPQINEQAKGLNDDGESKEGEAPESTEEHFSSSESEEYEITVTLFERMKADALRTFYYSKKGRMDGWSDVGDDENETARCEVPEKSAVNVAPDFEKHTRQIGSRILSKMGFAGRLGARGTGISQPLAVPEPLNRAGLGSRQTDQHLGGDEPQDPRSFGAKSGSISSILTAKPQANDSKQIMKKSKKKKRHQAKTKDEDVIVSVGINHNGTFRDNGRRGIIVDFDALLWNSHARRLSALNAFVASYSEFSSVGNVEALLTTREGDLCDREFIRKLLEASEIPVNEQKISEYMDKLDAAFAKAPTPDVDEPLILKLKKASEKLMVGVIHYGSQRRMNRELKIAGLQKLRSSGDFFLSEEPEVARVSVEGTDQAPYLQAWRDIFCQLGVHPCQSVMVLNDHGRSRVLSGVVAACILGARSFVRVDSKPGPGYSLVTDLKLGRNNMFSATMAAPDKVFAPHIDFVKFTRIVLSRQVRHVWARYSADALWYAGREHFRPTLPASDDDGELAQLRVLVQFDGYNNIEWVGVNDVHPLLNEGYLKLKEKSFPGLLDPDIDTVL